MPADSPAPYAADRNLLFGILALQMDFISRDALIAAMNAWVLDKGKALGEILRQQGALRPEDHDLLNVLIKRHLQIHGGNPQQSLAALGSVDSLRQELQQVADPELKASLAYLPDRAEAADDDPFVTRPVGVGQPSVPGLRFRILREHARGGLGTVFVAQDEELHREVALKEIQQKHADHSESRTRFLLEAEVTGALEHPGIVPVYGLGRYPDGRPFYAMRFIRGNSLNEAIKRFYAADDPKRDPGERSLSFRELLGAFVAACNAIAYAHSRGILHRDIKPHNIMLGKYGETLLVDWGLAKVLGHLDGQTKAEEGMVRPMSGTGTAPTQMGHVMGTPAYMSPEQAEGRLDELGPACDIYSLGATLYEILTGREPIQGTHVGEILSKVRQGDWLPPRKARHDVPAPLDAICCKALALRPGDRYSSALELAAEIEHWLADEPVAAFPEPWTGRLRRWLRRHKGLAAGTAGLFITALVALALGFVAVSYQKNLTEKARQRLWQSFEQMTGAVIDSWMPRQIRKEELERSQKDFLEKALGYYQDFAQEAGESEEVRGGVAEAYRRVGDITSRLGQNSPAEQAYRQAVAGYDRLATDFPKKPEYRAELGKCKNNLANLLKDIGRTREAEQAFREGITVLQQLVNEFADLPRYRQELATSYNNLGILLKETVRPREAEEAYRKALALNEQLVQQAPDVPENRQDLAISHNNLGNLLQVTGRPKEAEKEYRDTVALYQQLQKQFPTVARYHHEFAKCQSNLGLLLQATSRPQEAEQAYRSALTAYGRLLAEFPGVPRYRQELAACHNNLGVLLKETERPKEAEAAYQQALAIRQQLVTDYPNLPDYRQGLAKSHHNRGALLAELGRLDEAEQAYQSALALQRKLLADYPDGTDYGNDLALTLVDQAELLRERKQYEPARQLLEAALPHHQAALHANPHNPLYRQVYQSNRIVLASLLAALGDQAGALRTAEQLAGQGWDPAGDAYAAARALAQCSRLVPMDGQHAERVRAFAARALALLEQAVEKGFRDAGQLTKDGALAPLRSLPEFQQLQKKLAGH